MQELVDGSQCSVRKSEGGNVSETRAQVKVSKGGQRNERQLVSRSELNELNVVQGGQGRQGQRTGHVGDGVQVDACNGTGVEHSDISLNGLNLAQVQGTNLITGDGDLTVQGRTGVQLRHSTGGSDGGGQRTGVGRGGVSGFGGSKGSQDRNETLKRKHSECVLKKKIWWDGNTRKRCTTEGTAILGGLSFFFTDAVASPLNFAWCTEALLGNVYFKARFLGSYLLYAGWGSILRRQYRVEEHRRSEVRSR